MDHPTPKQKDAYDLGFDLGQEHAEDIESGYLSTHEATLRADATIEAAPFELRDWLGEGYDAGYNAILAELAGAAAPLTRNEEAT